MKDEKDDKFIVMNMDDSRSKKVAEVMGNPTCKKIIDYLTYNSEKSEEDIARALDMKINTVEYNLKKLLASGLVEKTKNFFWSKRGKKIPLYKLAKKHIVISPKNTRPNVEALKTILPIIIAAAAIVILVALLIPSNNNQVSQDLEGMQTFTSLEELENFLEANQASDVYYGAGIARGEATLEEADSAVSAAAAPQKGSTSADDTSASEYSETNIQVQGVDEPDIVKNDGKYIYTISEGKVIIVDAFPAESMNAVSEIEIKNPRNLFINKDKLIILSQDYSSTQKSLITIYDITDKGNPKLTKEMEIDGYYVDARMIDEFVYLIASQHTRYNDVILPSISVDGVVERIAATDISYLPYPDSSYTFTNIVSVNLNDETYSSETFLLGSSYTIYVSANNMYLTAQKRMNTQDYFDELIQEVFLPILPSEQQEKVEELWNSDEPFYIKQREISEVVEDYSMSLTGTQKGQFDLMLSEKLEVFSIELQKRLEQTLIHKIAIDEDKIEYIANGMVPGYVLNQFSMDEHDDYFRIATTTGNSWRATNLNHLYVLDEDLEIVGSVEDIAEDERIYSVRFLGERAYMVTFRQVDPLFVIDLSDPRNPEILGELKVTGYSSYLHPYDENHIIGVGKEATEEGRVQGVKIALFDVSDVENPIEKAKYEIEEQWSNSNALYDHKAFLFDREKELLVLPVSYSFEQGTQETQWGIRPIYNYWQGAFVFNINEDEISVRGKVTHNDNATEYRNWLYQIERSLYMDDTLYTISKQLIKANDVETLEEINALEFPLSGYDDYPIPYYEGDIGIAVSSAVDE